ncbi:MAG: hypothetical protein CO094_06490 [Anaerolineae bacterium CG_4_9_14_3_um_filter_57_17]|nr:5'-methylthioadenosine/S-adenosylhomocysteine nucleosidase [bacterium]NCT21529.1 5'-methylthioadenosine/S-adenosylhomocysteine nucleosidase [bacterium]OIO86788.1 MAG: hypothetical protein AUK01_02015 [Anaerolineae bacterium CG2_30_57_67]PJB66695.1 MAG: hypothetical protein CO094_06490 [Anaerolineae bacterium CG_4_9_14_3_um_filter_57_17]
MSAPASVVLVSAGAEWRAVKEILRPAQVTPSPLGEWFDASGARFFHGGWGKISAAASAQYVIDHFSPQILVNLGTCGGFDGRIQPGDLLLVEKTITYDIFEQMGDSAAAIEFYSTWLDLSWLRTLPATPALRRGLMVSADRDILPADIATLIEKYDARAADWESSAIAWVAVRNGVRVLILRGVTDLVSPHGGEAYGDLALFQTRTRHIMSTLLTWWKDWSGNLKG